jgi:hypothetical protein
MSITAEYLPQDRDQRIGDAARTERVIAAIQADDTCWAGITVWQGRTAMRTSVSGWGTTDDDVDFSLEAMLRVAAHVRQ